MKKYYKLYDDTGALETIGTGNGGIQITKEEYDSLLSEIREKADLVDALYSGEITIDSVKEEWQEEIQRRANEQIEAEKNAEPEPDTYQEAVDSIMQEVSEIGY